MYFGTCNIDTLYHRIIHFVNSIIYVWVSIVNVLMDELATRILDLHHSKKDEDDTEPSGGTTYG